MKNLYTSSKIILAFILTFSISNAAQSSASDEELYLSSGSFSIRNTEVTALEEFIIDGALRNKIDVKNEIDIFKKWFEKIRMKFFLLSFPGFRENPRFSECKEDILHFYENILAVFHDAYSNQALNILKEMRKIRMPADAFVHNIPTNDEKVIIDEQLKEKRSLMRLFSTIILNTCDINNSYGIVPITDSEEERQFAYYLEQDGTYSTSSFNVVTGWNIVRFLTSDAPFPQSRIFMTHYDGRVYYIAPTAGFLITYKSNYLRGYDSYEIQHQILPHTCLEQSATCLQPKNIPLRNTYPVFADIIEALKEDPTFQATGRGFLPIPSTEEQYQEADLALLKMALENEDETLIRTVALMIENPGLLAIEAAPTEEEVEGVSGSGAILGETPTVSEADGAAVPAAAISVDPRDIIQTRISELETMIRAQQEARSAAVVAGITPSTKKAKPGKKGGKKDSTKGKRSGASSSASVTESPVASGSGSSSSLPEITGAMSWDAFTRFSIRVLQEKGISFGEREGRHHILRNASGHYAFRRSTDTISAAIANMHLRQAMAALEGQNHR